jgi:hypothetical protein
VVAEHFIAVAPRKSVCEKRQPERGRPEQRDLLRLRADELRAQSPRLLDVAQHVAELLRILRRLPRVSAHRIGHASGQGVHAGVREKDFLAADREKRAAFGFVGEEIHAA